MVYLKRECLLSNKEAEGREERSKKERTMRKKNDLYTIVCLMLFFVIVKLIRNRIVIWIKTLRSCLYWSWKGKKKV